MVRKKKSIVHSPQSTVQVYVVILVGGKGKRLRPLSTDARPKAFLSVTKDRKTMFRKTLDRARALVPLTNILVVANKRHKGIVKKDFPNIKRANLLLEPVSRNTGPAIALAASVLAKRPSGAIMAVLPTDQYIMDEDRYLASIKSGIRFAQRDGEAIVVLGVKPTHPSTELGYIKIGDRGPGTGEGNIYKVERFVEKPDLDTAKAYVKTGKYLWNLGAFIFRASCVLTEMGKFAPEITALLVSGDPIKRYGDMPDISIDYAVMEKAEKIYCVKGLYEWQDMGSFESLRGVLRQESRSFVETNGKILKIL